MEDDDGGPFFAVFFLERFGGADGVGQQTARRSVDDLAGNQLGVSGELGGAAAMQSVPVREAVGDRRAGEGGGVGGEIDPTISRAEGVVVELESAAGDGAFDFGDAAEGEATFDFVAGLFEFHEAQVGQPKPSEVDGLCFSCLGIGPPTLPRAGLAASNLIAAVEGVAGIIEGPLPVRLVL